MRDENRVQYTHLSHWDTEPEATPSSETKVTPPSLGSTEATGPPPNLKHKGHAPFTRNRKLVLEHQNHCESVI